jgi:ketosteroid isomerase-like protein
MVRHAVGLALEAENRGDVEVTFALHHADSEAIFPPQLVALGFERVYRGREARIGAERRWIAEMGEFRFEPEELIDLGDNRLLAVGRIKGSGLSSGAEFDNDWGLLLTIAGGQVIREQFFLDRREALEAARLRE